MRRLRTSSCFPRRKGFVLVSVLMLGALLIACATAFTWFVRMQVRSVLRERVALTNRSMAQLLTRAVIQGISEASNRNDADSLAQSWFKPFPVPVDELGLWVAQVTPLDDKIPIRNLFLPGGNTLRGELAPLWEDMWDTLKHREMATLVLDFLDKDDKPRVGGAERKEFINRAPLDLSELLLVEGMTPELLYGGQDGLCLSDFCTVWSDGKINLNVAPRQVLSLLPGLNDSQAGQVVEYRRDRALRSMEDLEEIPGLTPRNTVRLTNLVAFKSRYFALHIEFTDDSPGGTAFNIIFDKTAKQVVRWEES